MYVPGSLLLFREIERQANSPGQIVTKTKQNQEKKTQNPKNPVFTFEDTFMAVDLEVQRDHKLFVGIGAMESHGETRVAEFKTYCC